MTRQYEASRGLVRVYESDVPSEVGLVWAHGGGFAFGDLDMPEADWVAHRLAEHGVCVVSVDYRLAPQSAPNPMATTKPAGWHYPAASDDVIEAFRWASKSDLASRWAIGGASAGANLATGATLRLLDESGLSPALVLLAYPTLLAVQPPPSAELRAALDAAPDADVFGPATLLAMYENYLGTSVQGAPIAAVPGLATPQDLLRFPRTVMINGEVDELRVSGELFASTLRAAGRDVAVYVEPGTVHGHLNRPEEGAAWLSIDRMLSHLGELS